MKNRWIGRALKFIAFVALMLTGVGLLVMSLWNVLIPQIFAGPTITFWQALGLLALSRLLFSGFLGPWGWRGAHRARGYWQKRWEKKLASMPEAEREKIRQAYAQRCGHFKSWASSSSEKQSSREAMAE